MCHTDVETYHSAIMPCQQVDLGHYEQAPIHIVRLGRKIITILSTKSGMPDPINPRAQTEGHEFEPDLGRTIELEHQTSETKSGD